MSGGQMMVVLIVAIVMIASIFKRGGGRRRRQSGTEAAIASAEAERMREELKTLKERVAVLERIATDKNHMLEAEFDRLRDR
jgi:Tfp pilus assembly protein PilO